MNFLQFAIWGAYLTCMGAYLHTHGLGRQIGLFYSIQGIVSIFMPAILGIIADRWIQAQKVLGLCHLISGVAMISAGLYGLEAGDAVQFGPLFALYTIGVAFYMPTIALSNSVAYNALEMEGLDRVKHFPPIRVFGTVGFIFSMWCVDLFGFQHTANQFIMSGLIGLLLGLYAFTLPKCNTNDGGKVTSIVDMFGLKAFALFKQRKMAVFFIFSVLLGVSLQITNGFANPFLHSFRHIPEYAGTFGVNHANMLISLSQISETLCILLIPFCLKKFGYKVDDYYAISYLIEKQMSDYIAVFKESSAGWEDEQNNYAPYCEFLVKTILQAYRRLEYIIEINALDMSTEDKVLKIVQDSATPIGKHVVRNALYGVQKETVDKYLSKLASAGKIQLIQRGDSVKYFRN